VDDERRVDVDPRLGECLPVARVALGGGFVPLAGAEVGDAEPALAGRFAKGWLLPNEGQLDNRQALRALAATAASLAAASGGRSSGNGGGGWLHGAGTMGGTREVGEMGKKRERAPVMLK